MNLKKIVLPLTFLVSLSPGCALNEGTVTDKFFKPDSHYIEIRRLSLNYSQESHHGKIPILVHEFPDYCVFFRGNNGKTAVVYMKNKEYFDRVAVGQHFKFDSSTADRTDQKDLRKRLTMEEYKNLTR